MYEILQDRNIIVPIRAYIVLTMAEKLQEASDNGDYEEIANITKEYNNADYRKKLVDEIEVIDNPSVIRDLISQILNMYEGLENIKPEWKEILETGENHVKNEDLIQDKREFLYYYEKEYEFEHILVYYIFNYFLGASYDNDILTKVKFAVVSYIVILQLDVARWITQDRQFTYEDQVAVAHAYSKEVEHSYNNYESLQLVLSAHPILTVDNIIKLLFQ